LNVGVRIQARYRLRQQLTSYTIGIGQWSCPTLYPDAGVGGIAPALFLEKNMSGYSINIEEKTLTGNNFREVLYTTQRSQLVIMTLQPNEEIGMEHHTGHDQFIRVEAGQGVAILDGEKHALEDGVAVVIPAGTEHNVINTSTSEPLRLYTLYTPPEHPDGIIHKTKAEADEYEKQQHGH
jgi:mannose-6-phosphate isomerase-like protein (cupin superfamily)